MTLDRSCFADVLVIGGGIAGASVAYELSKRASVLLLEREDRCGYHSTGRSAASFTENYGGTVIRRLAIASRAFLETPPTGFCEHPILTPLGMITIAQSDQLADLADQFERAHALVPSIVTISAAEARERVPILRESYVAAAFLEPHSREIDVDGLHQGFLRGAKAQGARLTTQAGVTAIERRGAIWAISTPSATLHAPILVNAAGAWADLIADMAGAARVGLVPKRRTAFNVPVPTEMQIRDWPMVNDVAESFYFKRDAGQLFISPADATPVAPTDVYPDEVDVAIGVERFERATTLTVQRVSRSWAGLRTFAPDGAPVVGPDERIEGFYWLAGQGGYGIKTSPALARACVGLILDRELPEDLRQLGITAAELSPRRFGTHAGRQESAAMPAFAHTTTRTTA